MFHLFSKRTAAVAAAALCLCMIAAGCGNKDTDTSSIGETSSIVQTTDSAGSEASSSESTSGKETSSKDTSSKASSKESSKAESAAASKAESAKAESSQAAEKANTKPAESTAPAEESKADSSSVKYHAGDTVAVYVKFGHIAMNGQPAKIGAYDYWLSYDASALEYVSSSEQTTSDLKMVNEKEAGMVKIAHIAALGFSDDYTGEEKPTYKVTFKVRKDTDDLGLSGQCPSLAAVSMDGKTTQVLVNNKGLKDTYSDFSVEIE